MTLTRGQKFEQKGKSKHGHCSAMSNTAWCVLITKGDLLKVHDNCSNPKCKCQKQITVTPSQFKLEGAGFSKTKKNFKGRRKAWDSIHKPIKKTLAPDIGMVIGDKSKNLQVEQSTTNVLRSI